MASSIIHIAVANELNKKLNRDKNKLLIGSIAPDIWKLIGIPKTNTHFHYPNTNIPNLDRFLEKYKEDLNDDFVLGYYIHLITDYLWFKYFITEINSDGIITKIDGTKVKCTGNMFNDFIYNDYTNLNIKIIDEYNLDLKIFYSEIPDMKDIIKEIPIEKLNLIIDKAGQIIENSKSSKAYLFNIESIKKFIATSNELILSNLKDLKVYKEL